MRMAQKTMKIKGILMLYSEININGHAFCSQTIPYGGGR
jgi:hypothetical protein